MVFLVLIPLYHSNYFKLCELDYFQWVLIREVCLLLVELLKCQYLFKCIVALETQIMVAVEHNIHINLKFKDVIIRFLFSECSCCNYLGEQSETIIYYNILWSVLDFLCILCSCVLWINTCMTMCSGWWRCAWCQEVCLRQSCCHHSRVFPGGSPQGKTNIFYFSSKLGNNPFQRHVTPLSLSFSHHLCSEHARRVSC